MKTEKRLYDRIRRLYYVETEQEPTDDSRHRKNNKDIMESFMVCFNFPDTETVNLIHDRTMTSLMWCDTRTVNLRSNTYLD